MADRLEEIESRWHAAKPGPWRCTPSDTDPDRVDVRHRGGGLVGERLDLKDAEAIAAAPKDLEWLVQQIRSLRREIFRLGGGPPDTLGKSRQGDITLATFKIERPEGEDED